MMNGGNGNDQLAKAPPRPQSAAAAPAHYEQLVRASKAINGPPGRSTARARPKPGGMGRNTMSKQSEDVPLGNPRENPAGHW